MPDQRRFRRLGVTSAAVTVGAFALLVGGASPADAATTKCAKGHDPATTIKSIQCQLQEAGKNFQKAIDKLTHKTPPPVKTPAKKPTAKSTVKDKITTKQPSTPAIPQGTGNGAVTGTTPLSNVNSVRPYTPQGTQPQLPILLPQQPQVADQQPYGSIAETHLVAPVAAIEQQPQVSAAWVAGAAGMAGAVGAFNLGLAGRRRRIRP
jgi:hypothetical protein